MSTEGIKTVLHPVSDVEKAKPVYTALLGVSPQTDGPYYVGFEVAGQHIGLLPGGGPQGLTSPLAYWHVSDIEATLAEVTAARRHREGARPRRRWRPSCGNRHRPGRQRPRAAAGPVSTELAAICCGFRHGSAPRVRIARDAGDVCCRCSNAASTAFQSAELSGCGERARCVNSSKRPVDGQRWSRPPHSGAIATIAMSVTVLVDEPVDLEFSITHATDGTPPLGPRGSAAFLKRGARPCPPWTPLRPPPSSRSTIRPLVVPTSSGRRRRTSLAPAAPGCPPCRAWC